MNDKRLQEIVDNLGDQPCPVVMLTVLSDVVDEVDHSWRARIKELLDSGKLDRVAFDLICETFPEAQWVETHPDEHLSSADEAPALPRELLLDGEAEFFDD